MHPNVADGVAPSGSTELPPEMLGSTRHLNRPPWGDWHGAFLGLTSHGKRQPVPSVSLPPSTWHAVPAKLFVTVSPLAFGTEAQES